MASLARYERDIAPARARFAHHPWVAGYITTRPEPDVLERFLIYYCALGYQMTSPVAGWIRRAGERCAALGLRELGHALLKHAHHEAGHESMMAKDARSLIDRRARAGRSRLNADRLLALPPTPGIDRYVRLHEETIAGDAPHGQIAIEYEIEQLSVTFGGPFIKGCVEALGPDVRSCLSFLEEHVALDVGHTHFNANQIERALDRNPELLPGLVAAGGAALDAYSAFLDDCARLAESAGSAAA
jgi:hypothetical protein